MITVGIDARMIHHTGIGTYLQGLLNHLPTVQGIQSKIFLPKSKAVLNLPFKTACFEAPIYSIQEQLGYPKCLKQCQVWHAPHYNIPLLKGKTKLVVTIHDLIHWIYRKEFFSPFKALYAGAMLSQAVRKADHIIAVSQKTKEDLIHHFQARPEKISVIYEGIHPRFQKVEKQSAIDTVLQKLNIPKSYFLYVGMLKPHKGVHELLSVYQKIRQTAGIRSALVIVGRKDKTYAAKYRNLEMIKTGNGIIYLPFVEADDLVALYNGARALVHPSFYEGFGLTLLEAMSCGAPVIARQAGSIPEIAGEAAYLFESEKALAEALIRFEQDEALCETYQNRGKLRIKSFSWEKTARETLEVYQKVAANQ